MDRRRILVTGGCGFVGHHVVEHFLKTTTDDLIVLDMLTYASTGFDRLRDIEAFDSKRVTVFSCDISRIIPDGVAKEIGEVDVILHLAAESHVDRSIAHPVPFVLNNVAATLGMMEYARTLPNLQLFVNFSTDEVYGPAPEGIAYAEFTRHRPTNPYSASKSAQEALGIAYSNTYRIPIITTHTMNVFGERQHPEKFIPLVISKILAGEIITIHADATCTKPGSRFYIHARNVAAALSHIMALPYTGYDEFNIVGEREVDNLTLACMIAKIMDLPTHCKMVDFHSSRPGHDLRYALDGTKLKNSGFKIPMAFEESLERTVLWTLDHPVWLY
jgi:dTDP-glucose 4,6-dehydratase